MDWLGGVEIVAGLAGIALGLFLIRVFRFVPVPGVTAAAPSHMRLALVPVGILLVFVVGISLLLTGLGVL